ncbi:hypothetical protein FPQ18DRAFT_416478 [Pyronema domesticum]|nr:hypothetical protein FPQ18DRAFT_416478 [Pyronema domesticum]
MKLFASLYLFAIIAIAVAAPVADAEVKPNTVSPQQLDSRIFDMLVLPDDFDMNHPAFNLTYMESLGLNEPTPKLPAEVLSNVRRSHLSYMSVFHDKLSCKRNDAFNSALAEDITGSVRTQICGRHNVCIDCRYIAAAAIEVANRCPGPRSFGTAKGYKHATQGDLEMIVRFLKDPNFHGNDYWQLPKNKVPYY